MVAPIVIEIRRELEPVTTDSFIAARKDQLGLIISEGQLSLDSDHEVITGACTTRDGEIVHEAARAAAEDANRHVVQVG